MKHSPGPLHVGEGLASHIIYNAQGYAVGNTSTYHNHISEEQGIANAVLFAAAPELLEQLERMVNIATHPKATKEQIRMIANESKAAIYKAKGN